MANILPIGKLDSKLLEDIVFSSITYKREETVKRAGIGEDCAAVDFGSFDCIVSTDPITASVKDVGRLSIHISCNDIATNGIQPIGILLTVLLPKGITDEDVRQIMSQAAKAAERCQVEIIGGHTEVTDSVKQPVIVSTAIGRSPKEYQKGVSAMQAGDLIYITKSLGLEGTGIIASEKGEDLLAANILSREELGLAIEMLDQVSVVKEGVLGGTLGVVSMHDITEGGVLGAVWELCSIAKCGACLLGEKMPVEEVTSKICLYYGMNPLRLISSGSMLMIVEREKAEVLEQEMAKAEISITCIGEVTDGDVVIVSAEGDAEIVAPPAADELYKVV